MARSQNGWTVHETPPPRMLVPGTDIRLSVRPGDVGFLLTRVAAWFHREIEPLDMPVKEVPGYDDWGWAYRPVRGQQDGFSNHASGTAVDLNATQHPRGVKGTFTPEEKARVRAHLRAYDGVIRWGEDYSGTVDGMHFEINAGPGEVAEVANKLRALDARAQEDDMALSDADLAKVREQARLGTIAALETKRPVFDYLDGLYNLPDNQMSTRDAAQHAAAQALAAVRAVAELRERVEALGALVEERLPAPETPPTVGG